MRDTLRQLSRVVPLLFLVTLLVFALTSRRALVAPGAPTPDPSLPSFFNPNPRDLRVLAQEAMLSIASQSPDGGDPRRLLELGGAALPYVVPILDTLSPEGRKRVAEALVPLADRMGISSAESADAASPIFWQRFWQQSSIDFRPVVVRGLVERLANRESGLSRRELLRLDTYALPELVARLGTVRHELDVERAYRLTAVLAHITELSPQKEDEIRASKTGADARVVHKHDDVAKAKQIVERWQDWWSLHRTQYQALDGTERMLAVFGETLYGKWLLTLVRRGPGVDVRGNPIVDRLFTGLPVTFGLVAFGWLFGYVGLSRLVMQLKRESAARSSAPQALATVFLVLLCSPVVLFFSAESQSSSWVLALSAFAIYGYAPKGLCEAYGAPPWIVGFPGLFGLAVVVEPATGLDGIGHALFDAVRYGDRNLLVLLALMGLIFRTLGNLVLGFGAPMHTELKRETT